VYDYRHGIHGWDMADAFAQPWAGLSAGQRDALRRPRMTPLMPSLPCLSEEAREDAALAIGAAAGDGPAFEELVDRYSSRIYAHLYRLVRNREEAEDLTQETFLRVYRNLKKFEPTRSFKSWIYTIATNAGLNALRSRKRRGIPVPLDGLDAAPSKTAPRELRDELNEAMKGLGEQPGVLVHLHYQEGMSIREAADVVGITEGAAKVALHRARKQLRELLIEARRERV
jgi:RNA polymerase sigma-70 factor, ECF subfamily